MKIISFAISSRTTFSSPTALTTKVVGWRIVKKMSRGKPQRKYFFVAMKIISFAISSRSTFSFPTATDYNSNWKLLVGGIVKKCSRWKPQGKYFLGAMKFFLLPFYLEPLFHLQLHSKRKSLVSELWKSGSRWKPQWKLFLLSFHLEPLFIFNCDWLQLKMKVVGGWKHEKVVVLKPQRKYFLGVMKIISFAIFVSISQTNHFRSVAVGSEKVGRDEKAKENYFFVLDKRKKIASIWFWQKKILNWKIQIQL